MLFRLAAFLCGAFVLLNSQLSPADDGTLTDWRVSIDGGQNYRMVKVPGTIENQIDSEFDGVSIYETKLPTVRLRDNQRLRLRFEAVATSCRVFVNDELIGEHLGGWTPFEVDATQALEKSRQQTGNVLRVEVDELVGHNTQGFLPVITNHFGGIWQPVTWKVCESVAIDQDRLFVTADFETNRLNFLVPVSTTVEQKLKFDLSIRELRPSDSLAADADWSVIVASETSDGNEFEFNGESPIKLREWSPVSPMRYEFRVRCSTDDATDEIQIATGFRGFVVEDKRFVLNGRAISLRGVLNWGYAPPSFAPSLDEAFMRREIEFAKSRGFNLMKFCLWVPPRRYLELCDELGMLAWVEYPTWHPQLDDKHLKELKSEYQEFFEYDRTHPSVVLRSLTCETGPSADIEVVRALYQQCKDAIPNAVVEDDSSWIEWNRVHDFYDDHPYGNNHTWVSTLERLKNYVEQHEMQPLILGEAIAADSWTVPDEKMRRKPVEFPGHAPWSLAAAEIWTGQIQRLASERQSVFRPDQLREQSLHYGQLMRKFQIEVFRREVPEGGYVVSVIRDFPKAAMGLIGYGDEPKLSEGAWGFHGDQMFLLKTPNDHRSFWSGAKLNAELTLTGASDSNDKLSAVLELVGPDERSQQLTEAELKSSTGRPFARRMIEIDLPVVEQPERWVLRATLAGKAVQNEWPIWIIPELESKLPAIWIHTSATELAKHLDLKHTTPFDQSSSEQFAKASKPQIILTQILDSTILSALEANQHVLMIPNGQAGSFPLSEHWFLRGGPVVLEQKIPWTQSFELQSDGRTSQQNMLVELQHFDLAGPVVPQIDGFLDVTNPWLLLWDNHDLNEVRTHGVVFEMEIGEAGKLFVSCLDHTGATNAAGHWLLNKWLDHLSQSNLETHTDQKTRAANLDRLTKEINRRGISLGETEWKFRPDPDNIGKKEQWFAPEFDDREWVDISINGHWEGQGYEALDHWAWYRQRLQLPADWHSPKTYLNFTGVDDYADVFVNGKHVGSIGNIESRQTGFEMRVSFDISQFVEESGELSVAVGVYDWYGAGGLFRPVTVTTEPLETNPPMLK